MESEIERTAGIIANKSMEFTSLPMPPSSNNQYSLFRRGRKTYHVPSKELMVFKQALSVRFLPNQWEILRDYWTGYNGLLSVHCEFIFPRENLFSKKDRVKKLDVSNRLKAIHDSLSQQLGLDDSMFFKISAEKRVGNRTEVNVTIQSCDL